MWSRGAFSQKENVMTRWNDQESRGSGLFLLGALSGALVGAGVALLMAPKSGAEVRHDLNSGLNTMRDAASRRYRDIADRAGERIGRAQQTATERFSGGTTPSMGESFGTTPGATGFQS
jgi:gas vesicle protein